MPRVVSFLVIDHRVQILVVEHVVKPVAGGRVIQVRPSVVVGQFIVPIPDVKVYP